MQVDTRERGFSYSYEAPLDMRMDPEQELSAREIVGTWDERRLARALRDFGEERHAGAIARAIVARRAQAPIETTLELVETINSAIPAPARFGGGHPAKRSFQALRIAVNDELGQLDRALPLAWSLLREGGVLAGISFHSLEDRRIKRFLAARAQGCICPPDLPVCACGREPEAALLTRRSIVPSPEEIARNPRASSARLRAAQEADRRRGLGAMTPPRRRSRSGSRGSPAPRARAAQAATRIRPCSPGARLAPGDEAAPDGCAQRDARRRPAARGCLGRRGARAAPAARPRDPRAHVDRHRRVRADRHRRAAARPAEAQRRHRARARA